jgi:hypothetical protein
MEVALFNKEVFTTVRSIIDMINFFSFKHSGRLGRDKIQNGISTFQKFRTFGMLARQLSFNLIKNHHKLIFQLFPVVDQNSL